MPSASEHQQDRLLARDEEPALGAHLVTPRPGFTHHGIYVGDGRVVHYGSFASGWRRRPVEEVPLARFSHGFSVRVRPSEAAGFESAEVVRRARSRLGEDSYRLFTNNCEHFTEWCLHGEHRSYQVERLLTMPRQLAHAAGALAAMLLVVPSIRTLWS